MPLWWDRMPTLRQERMRQHMLTDLDRYHRDYGLTHERLRRNGAAFRAAGPGRGIEMAAPCS